MRLKVTDIEESVNFSALGLLSGASDLCARCSGFYIQSLVEMMKFTVNKMFSWCILMFHSDTDPPIKKNYHYYENKSFSPRLFFTKVNFGFWNESFQGFRTIHRELG